ncbi:cytidine deaminase family protein [Fructilactobacillus frigidiflavus]|uniref:cytidine deaminase family protein n=1 Tax=Fructilactobacillus frigidiflavus TaxID=3242688 RepID=UPI003757DB97
MMNNEIWNNLYKKALSVCNGHDISESIFAGSVASAILTDKENIYLGVSVDTACSLGFCAERNAIGTMLTFEKSKVIKVVTVRQNGEIVMPCVACREFLMQLNGNQGTQILVSQSPLQAVKLTELMPKYWK